MTATDHATVPTTPVGVPHRAGESAGVLSEDVTTNRFRVHRSAFTSKEIFELERERLWLSSWLYLGHESEVRGPGDFVTRTLAGRPLLLVRGSDGVVRAFLNACPHRGTTVCRTDGGTAKHFTCFYHAWTFANDGALISLPDPDAYSIPNMHEELSLRPVPRLEVYRGFIFVSFNPDVPNLVEHLGGATDCLDLIAEQSPGGVEVVGGTHLYHSRTNWKLAVENALDGYHFVPTHTTFMDFRKRSGFQSPGVGGQWRQYEEGRHVVVEGRGFYGRAGLSWEPAWGEDERVRIEERKAELRSRLGPERAQQIADWSRNTFVFPNLLCFDFISVSLRVLEPLSPGVTEIRVWTLAPVDESPESRKLRLENVVSFVGPGGFATPDDLEAQQCAQEGYWATEGDSRADIAWNDVSRGMAAEHAGLETGINDEGHLRAFWRHWARTVGV